VDSISANARLCRRQETAGPADLDRSRLPHPVRREPKHYRSEHRSRPSTATTSSCLSQTLNVTKGNHSELSP
jgi:hypothetical protein